MAQAEHVDVLVLGGGQGALPPQADGTARPDQDSAATGGPDQDSAGTGSPPDAFRAFLLSPRLAAGCRIAMGVTMALMLVIMI